MPPGVSCYSQVAQGQREGNVVIAGTWALRIVQAVEANVDRVFVGTDFGEAGRIVRDLNS